MRNFVIFGGAQAGPAPSPLSFEPVDIDSRTVRSGIVHTNDLAFDADAPENAHAV